MQIDKRTQMLYVTSESHDDMLLIEAAIEQYKPEVLQGTPEYMLRCRSSQQCNAIYGFLTVDANAGEGEDRS